MDPIRSPDFESPSEALPWLLDQVRGQLDERKSQDLASEQEREVFITLTAFIRLAVIHANAVNVLAKEDLGEATPPLVRTMYEILMDFEAITGSALPRRQVQKLRISGLRDLKRYYELLAKRGDERAKGLAQKAEEVITELCEEDPYADKELAAQRRKRRPHWSGLTRTEMEGKLSKALLYQPYSWEAHAVAAPIRDFAVPDSASPNRVVFGTVESPGQLGELHSYGALSILTRLWNNYAARYRLRPIRGPSSGHPQ